MSDKRTYMRVWDNLHPMDVRTVQHYMTHCLKQTVCGGNPLLFGPLEYWPRDSLVAFQVTAADPEASRQLRAAIARAFGIRVSQLYELDTFDDRVLLDFHPDIHAEIEEQLRYNIVRNRYAELALNRTNTELRTVQNRISELRERLLYHEQSYVETRRRLLEATATERRLQQESSGMSREQLYKEFDALNSLPGLSNISVNRYGHLVGFTKEIIIEHLGVDYHIGEFEIVVGDDRIHMRNLTGCEHTHCHHPHVNSDGEPCFGEWFRTIMNALSEKHYDVVLQLCLQFLQGYTYDDSFAPIQCWGEDYDPHYDYRYHDGVELGDILPEDEEDEEEDEENEEEDDEDY